MDGPSSLPLTRAMIDLFGADFCVAAAVRALLRRPALVNSQRNVAQINRKGCAMCMQIQQSVVSHEFFVALREVLKCMCK